MEHTSLDDILNDKDEAPRTEPAPQAEAPAQEADADRPRDEHGRFIAKDTGVEQPGTQEAAPANEVEPPSTAPANGLPPQEYAALRDERRKRQQLEEQVAAMQRHFEVMQQAQVQPQAPQAPVDIWDDPDAWAAAKEREIEARLLQRLAPALQQQTITTRADVSEQIARIRHADYDEKFQAFREAIEANPMIAHQLAQAPDPAEYAYTAGKQYLEARQYGSWDDRLKAERAKWEAELKAALPSPALPPTTATERSVGARQAPWNGPTPLADLLSP